MLLTLQFMPSCIVKNEMYFLNEAIFDPFQVDGQQTEETCYKDRVQ